MSAYSENRYTLYRSVVLKNNIIATIDITGGGGRDLIWKFANILWWQNFFLLLWQDKSLWVELKTNERVIFITILPHFHYFIPFETANTQKSEVFCLRTSLGNVNTSVFTCWYPQIYNFSFGKEFVKNRPTSCISSF